MAESGAPQPRGILNRRAGEAVFDLRLHSPAPDLAYFVEHYWLLDWDLAGRGAHRQEVLAHPCVHLVFERGNSRVYGVVTEKFSRGLVGRGRVFGVKFKPGAFYPFLRAPVAQLTDRSVPFREIVGTDCAALEEAVLSREVDTEAIILVEAFLRSRAPERDAQIAAIDAIVGCISAERGVTTVAEVARRCNIGARTLQRLFQRYVGVGPKWVIRRYRLHEAAERLAADAPIDARRLALALGYFDQAHFIRDFKATVGSTPDAYARGASGTP